MANNTIAGFTAVPPLFQFTGFSRFVPFSSSTIEGYISIPPLHMYTGFTPIPAVTPAPGAGQRFMPLMGVGR